MAAWRAKITTWFERRHDAHAQAQFLPAALEILETPASPLGRIMALFICAFFIIASLWAVLGQVDIIATAPGRILPADKIKTIQPLESGVVRAIHIKDGDHVAAGQVLVELDGTLTGADQERLVRDQRLAQLDVSRLTALKPTAETGGAPAPMIFPPDVPSDDRLHAQAALRAQVQSQAAKIAAFDDQVAQKRAEEQEVRATMVKLNASVPILAEKARLHKALQDQGYGTSFAQLDAQQALSDARNELKVNAQRAAQTRAAQADIASRRAQAVAEYKAQILADLVKAEEKNNALTQELVKARQKSSNTVLHAPIAGVVEQLAIHTKGGVVTPAEHLMIVVPEEGGLTTEVQLSNQDVGFVRAGQDVAIKVETFTFTRYGLIQGKVLGVSRDAMVENNAPRASASQNVSPQVPQNGALNYTARIALQRNSIFVDGQWKPLMPGMAVTAEIKTGKRSVMDYLLSPLAKRSDEALHER